MTKSKTIVYPMALEAKSRYLFPLGGDVPPGFYEGLSSFTLDGKKYEATGFGRGRERSIAFALRELADLILSECPQEFE